MAGGDTPDFQPEALDFSRNYMILCPINVNNDFTQKKQP
jgi:hypothetical protein